MMEDRIKTLEKQLAHQEYAIVQLSELINDQAKLIEALTKDIKIIHAKMDDNLIDPHRSIDDDKPPHY